MDHIQNANMDRNEEMPDEALEFAAGGDNTLYAEYLCSPCRRKFVRRFTRPGPAVCNFCGVRRAEFIKFVSEQ